MMMTSDTDLRAMPSRKLLMSAGSQRLLGVTVCSMTVPSPRAETRHAVEVG